MAAVIKVENIFEPERRGHLDLFLLVAQNILRNRPAAAFLVVGSADQVAGIALGDQLGAQTSCKSRNIAHVGVHGDEHFTRMRLSGLIPFDGDAHKGTACAWAYLRMLST